MTTIIRGLKTLLNSRRKAKDHKQKPWPTFSFPKGKLPEKPSELIFTALRDLRACEEDPLYTINMGLWHSSRESSDGVCAVCLAGSVMAKSLDAQTTHQAVPVDFGHINRQKLRALDDLRLGQYEGAIYNLNARKAPSEHLTILPYMGREITPYRDDPEAFFEEMVQFAWDLHNRGQ